MKLAVSVFAGVVTASVLFSAVVLSSLTEISSFSAQLPPGWVVSNPLSVEIVVSNLTEPLGIGSKGTVTVIAVSTSNVSNVTVSFELYQVYQVFGNFAIGIGYIEGDLANVTWTGDLTANASRVFRARIKALEAGCARIRARVTWFENEKWLGHSTEDSLWILVQENSIQISHDPIPHPDLIEAQPGNGTLPAWPNGTTLNPIPPP